MSVQLLASVQLANRDAQPRIIDNPGLGGGGVKKTAYGYLLSVPASLSTTSVIRFVTVPSNALVRSVVVDSEAQTAGKFNIGVYRNVKDGGLVAVSGSDSFFTTDLDCSSAVINQDVTRLGTTGNAIDKMAQPLWQAIGMASDPCTDLDICATVHTTAVTTGTGKMGVRVDYTC